MSLDGHLIHTCVVERPDNLAANTYNNADSNWQPVANGQYQPCRLVVKEQRIWSDAQAEAAVVTKYMLLMGAEADLRERDRISKIVLEDGTVIHEVYIVSAILPRRAKTLRHLSATLKRVS